MNVAQLNKFLFVDKYLLFTIIVCMSLNTSNNYDYELNTILGAKIACNLWTIYFSDEAYYAIF